MRVEQISVFLENKAGRLAEVTRTLTEAGVDIRALSLADTSDFGILRLIVNDNDKATAVLKERGFTVGKTDVLAVEVEDHPGGLHKLLEMLSGAGVNVEYMYALVRQSGGNAVIMFRFDNPQEAIRVLQANGVAIVEPTTLYAI